MNSDYTYGGIPYGEVLALTSEGYSTRAAKRKVERDNRKRLKKLRKRYGK